MPNSERVLSGVLLIDCAASAAVVARVQQSLDAQRITDDRIGKHDHLTIALSDDIWRYSAPQFQEFHTAERIKSSLS